MGAIGSANTFIFNSVSHTIFKEYVIKRKLTDTTNVDLDPAYGTREVFQIETQIDKTALQTILDLDTVKDYARNGTRVALVDPNWNLNEWGFVKMVSIIFGPAGRRRVTILFERSL